ncbi:hypothetical protein [Clostridium sp. UBA3887]|uniref:hypothetical protein n=1 Tax=Clostridium sp. UBA3887 TaxID=1946356 RepID=UPI003217C6D3
MCKFNLKLYKKFSKDILSKKEAGRIKNYEDLLKRIKTYYEDKVNRDEIGVKLIIMENSKRSIKIGVNYSMILSQVSLIMSVFISVINFTYIVNHDYEMIHTNEISIMEKNKTEYWMKVLEIDYKLEIAKDPKEKEALQKYKSALQKQIDININNQISESGGITTNPSGIHILFRYMLILISIYIFVCMIMMIISQVINKYNETKLYYIEDRIKIIKQVMENSKPILKLKES